MTFLRAFILLLLAMSTAFAGDIIPASRRIDWTTVGVEGGIMVSPTETISRDMPVHIVLSPGVTTAQFQNAINTCPSNSVVQLVDGTIYVDTTLDMNRSGVVIRGTGKWVSDSRGTRIKTSASHGQSQVFMFMRGYDYDWNDNPVRSLVNCVKDSSTVTTSAAHGWAIGDLVILDQLEDPLGIPSITSGAYYQGTHFARPIGVGDRIIGQTTRVTGVPSSTTVTVNPPLYYSYNPAFSPQGVKISTWVHRSAVESLTVDTLESVGENARTIFQWQGTANCWLYDVELKGIYYRGIWGYGVFGCTIQHCYFNGGRPLGNDFDAHYTSDRAYGFLFGPHTSKTLVVDSMMDRLTTLAYEGCASGNAYLYNFHTNMWWKSTGVGEAKINFGPIMHGPYPFMNLLEGNFIEGRFRADNAFGSSGFWTIFRNRIWPKDRRIDKVNDSYFQWSSIDLERSNHMYNVVGNLLGSGAENVYLRGPTVYEDYGRNHTFADQVIYKLGYDYAPGFNTGGPGAIGTPSANYDPNVLATLLRWKNYDYFNNAVMYHVENVGDTNNTTLEASYVYGATRPIWWPSSLAWPPYDPDFPALNSPTRIPAGYLYIYGSNAPNTTGGSGGGGGGGGSGAGQSKPAAVRAGGF